MQRNWCFLFHYCSKISLDYKAFIIESQSTEINRTLLAHKTTSPLFSYSVLISVLRSVSEALSTQQSTVKYIMCILTDGPYCYILTDDDNVVWNICPTKHKINFNTKCCFKPSKKVFHKNQQ